LANVDGELPLSSSLVAVHWNGKLDADELIEIKFANDDVIAVGAREEGTLAIVKLSQFKRFGAAMMKQYVGLDVSQRETAICVVGEMGQVRSLIKEYGLLFPRAIRPAVPQPGPRALGR
jgi:hypothetical protein